MSTNNEMPIEQRVSLLEAKLRIAVDGLQRIGYESDGPGRLTERFGVDAAACRKILSAIGNTVPVGRPIKQHLPTNSQPTLSKPVVWSKDPSFRFDK